MIAAAAAAAAVLGWPAVCAIFTTKPRTAEDSCRRRNNAKKMKKGVICSIRRRLKEEAGSSGDRLRWIESREVPIARKSQGVDFPGYLEPNENMSHKANRTESVTNGLAFIGATGEENVCAEDPWLTKDQNGSLSNSTKQALDVVDSVPPTQIVDRSSTGQQAGRRISPNSNNYRVEEIHEDCCTEDNFACDDDLDVLVEDQGTLARETYLAGGLGNWDNSKVRRRDMSFEQNERSSLYKRSTLIAKQVVSVSNARNLGFVSQLWVNLQMLKVEALEVKPSLLSWEMDEILLSNMCKIGDVILVKNDNVLDGDLTVPNCEVLVGSDVLTESNMYLGKVRDYNFNLSNGAIVSIEMDHLGVSFIPAKMISTYLVMVDEIIEIASDCLLLRKGAEARIMRLTKGFLQPSIIDMQMLQAANSEFTRTREFRSERNGMGTPKGLRGAATYSSAGARISELEKINKRPKRDRSFLPSSVAVDPHIEETQKRPFKSSRQSSLSSSQPEKQSTPMIDSRYDYGKSQRSGTRSVTTQSADELKLIPSTENTYQKGEKMNHSLPIENQDKEDFRPGYGKDRWVPLNYSPKTNNQY